MIVDRISGLTLLLTTELSPGKPEFYHLPSSFGVGLVRSNMQSGGFESDSHSFRVNRFYQLQAMTFLTLTLLVQ